MVQIRLVLSRGPQIPTTPKVPTILCRICVRLSNQVSYRSKTYFRSIVPNARFRQTVECFYITEEDIYGLPNDQWNKWSNK